MYIIFSSCSGKDSDTDVEFKCHTGCSEYSKQAAKCVWKGEAEKEKNLYLVFAVNRLTWTDPLEMERIF